MCVYIYICIYIYCMYFYYIHINGLPWWLSDKEPTYQCRRRNPWVGKIPWRKKWQPTSVFLPGKSHGQRSLAGYSPWGCKRVGHDLATKQRTNIHKYMIFKVQLKFCLTCRLPNSEFIFSSILLLLFLTLCLIVLCKCLFLKVFFTDFPQLFFWIISNYRKIT